MTKILSLMTFHGYLKSNGKFIFNCNNEMEYKIAE